MNWKREAEQKLRNYAACRRALTAIPLMIEELKCRRKGVRSARVDGRAVSGGTNGREEMLVSSLNRQEELEQRLAATKVYVAGVEEALSALNEEEKLILDRFYIHPIRGCAGSLCEELCMERSNVYRRKDQALRHFTMALYGWEEA